MGFEWYMDFVDLDYKPSSNDLICIFKIYPASGITLEEAAGRVASESSIGTWTTLTTLTPHIKSLMARVYEIRRNIVKIAYPLEIFEGGNMPQILSSIAGNIFGMKALKALRLEYVRFPREIIEAFKGPIHGINGVRRILKIYNRPLIATVPKPKVGMTWMEHAKAGYEAWIGGVDLLKDDENLSNQRFNRFEERLIETLRMRDKAERETGERKGYLINITAETREMLRRAKLVSRHGGEFVMIDILTVGWAALQTVRDEVEDLKLAIHAHRAFHAAFTRSRRHGVSMPVIAEIARLIGVDHIHIGTAVGKLESTKNEVKTLKNIVSSRKTRSILEQEWYNIKPVFPVASGGLHPGLIPELIEILGRNIIIQVGGGIWGHPMGGKSGALAVRQAVDAAIKKIPLVEYAEKHDELKEALSKWSFIKPI
ncbi:MAG: type III ribulose-bisphosphate carboxylase [Candidatus Methanomethylicia archaeon]